MRTSGPSGELTFTYRTGEVVQVSKAAATMARALAAAAEAASERYATGDHVVKLSALKVDADKIEAGEWVGNIPEMGDLELKVRGLQNAQYRRLQAKLLDAVPRAQRQGGRVDPDVMDRIVSTCLGSTVLLDWRGLEGEDGEPLPYSKEQASEFLSKPEYRRFREATLYAATVVGEADAEAGKADEGNSSGT